ncbi:MAG: hypothetical protein WCR77_00650 [Bacilli bacterium]|jgi:putative Mn2+ efflux pump MntP|nr:hypothetical protein [Bacilli bacterium]
MKKALHNWLTYVIGGALLLVAVGIAIIPDIVDNYVATMEEWHAHYIFLFIGVAYIFVGFVWQDLLKAHHRRKTKNWDGPLSEDISNSAWAVSLPFYLAAVSSIIGGVIFTFVTI